MWKTTLVPKVLMWGVLGLLLPAQGNTADNLIKTTEYGQIQGTRINIKGFDKSVNAFLGIPFAKPPVGTLRFSPPQSPDSWSDVRDATSYPPLCLQDTTAMEKMNSHMKMNIPITGNSEDCLYLNIHTPDNTNVGAGLPVMVWIHGGGLVIGSASMCDGSVLSASQNVVVVSIQYRLGILGFFSTGDEHARGNWGYLDQVQALRWVQRNIANFGGDPDRVTIFGVSAGGISVSSLILSPMSKGLFHRAIMESGVAILPGIISSNSERVKNIAAKISACEIHSSASMVQCLRSKTEQEILDINKVHKLKIKGYNINKTGQISLGQGLYKQILISSLHPDLVAIEQFKIISGVVDGHFFPKHPEELLAAGEFYKVPSIIGVNNHEYGWIIPSEMDPHRFKGKINKELILSTFENPLMHIPPELGHLMIEEYIENTEDPNELQAQYQDMMGDMIFVIPSLKVAKYQQSSGSPVYFYEFQHPPSKLKDMRPQFVKADHGDELVFVFGVPFLEDLSEEEKLLSHRMMSYWANFARNGDPNGADLLHWPVYDQSEEYLQLNLQVSVGKRLKGDKFEFWTKTLPQKMKESLFSKDRVEL